MPIIAISFNHRTAPVKLREQFAVAPEAHQALLSRLQQLNYVQENVVLATCNRTEIYTVVQENMMAIVELISFLEQHFEVDKETFFPYLRTMEQEEAVEHLLHVASGLDSLILGETQILGQVKEALNAAQEAKTTGATFNRLFKQAITFAKRAHTQTRISENPVSVSYAAVELAKQLLGDLHGKSVVVIGAGQMAGLALKHLHAAGASRIAVVNRTYERAVRLAAETGAAAYPIHALAACLPEADLIISSTGASEYVLHKSMLEKARKTQSNRPLVLMDLAMPRDIDPAVQELAATQLYNIDDLGSLVDHNLAIRQEESVKIKAMINQETERFAKWQNRQRVHPILAAMQNKAAAVHEQAIQTIQRKLPELGEHDVEVIQKMTQSIVNQLMREPIRALKELALTPDADEAIALFCRMNGITSEQLEGLALHSDMDSIVPPTDDENRAQLTLITSSIEPGTERTG